MEIIALLRDVNASVESRRRHNYQFGLRLRLYGSRTVVIRSQEAWSQERATSPDATWRTGSFCWHPPAIHKTEC